VPNNTSSIGASVVAGEESPPMAITGTPKKRYGPWTPIAELGQGGNSVVWRATQPGSAEVALKVIKETQTDQETYTRFVREVTILERLGPQPGVLPMLESHLPESPTKADRAWLTMPIASPMASVLEDRQLKEVVSAVHSVAETLARLMRDHGIGHRDIKPGNLYELDGQWLIGDFGLVAVPGAEALTGDGRQVGPAHFTAYEMILNPSTADPHPADVYSLGKTLWVLATGQRYAPEGHQPAGVRGIRIGDFRPHPRAPELDEEIALMTQHRPEIRPTMEQVAADLAAWQELADRDPVFDLSGAAARMRAKIERAMSEQDAEQQAKDQAAAAARRLQELFDPINVELKRVYAGTEIDLMNDELTRNTLRVYLPGHGRIWDWRRCTRVAPLDGPTAMTLRVSRALELFDDKELYLHLQVLVAPAATMGQAFSWQLQNPHHAPVGTIEAAKMLDDGIGQLFPAVQKGVEALIEALPDLQSPG
jgi:hypothetical protein